MGWAQNRLKRSATLEKIGRLNSEAEQLFKQAREDASNAQRLNRSGDHAGASLLLVRSVQRESRGDLLITRIRDHYASIGERMP